MSCDLYQELIVEIFMRLSTKSLLRFRSVSKWLYACIGSPSFIRLHAIRFPNKAMIIHLIRGKRGYTGDILYTLHSKDQLSSSPYIGITAAEFPFRPYYIVGSCNGILCVDEYENAIHLWNPSIRRKVTIDGPPSWSDCRHERIIGFGFDPTIDDYKIVKIARSGTRRNSYVYTMKTEIWRGIAYPATTYSYQLSRCIFNGSLHWIIQWEDNDSPNCYVYILTFDLSSEVFSKIELPETDWKFNEVAVIKNCLAVISSEYDDCQIWVRREDNNNVASWCVAFKLNTYGLLGGGALHVCQLTADDDLLFYAYFKGIIAYNHEKRVHSRLAMLRADSSIFGMITCVESLELLGMGSSCDQESN